TERSAYTTGRDLKQLATHDGVDHRLVVNGFPPVPLADCINQLAHACAAQKAGIKVVQGRRIIAVFPVARPGGDDGQHVIDSLGTSIGSVTFPSPSVRAAN